MAANNRIEIPINGETYTTRSPGNNSQRCINWYPAKDPTGGTKLMLERTPGTRRILETSAPVRALSRDVSRSTALDWMYAVIGNQFVRITVQTEFTVTTLDIGTLTGINLNSSVEIINGTRHILIIEYPVSGMGAGVAYVYDKVSNTLTQITHADFPPNQAPALPVQSATYLDGYFVVSVRGQNRFYVSELEDPLTWDALRVNSATKTADNIVKVSNNKRELWVWGTDSVEVWFNSGNPDFVFEPMPNVAFEFGAFAPLAIAHVHNKIITLSRTSNGILQVLAFDGYTPQRISNPAIETMIENIVRPAFLNTSVVNTFGNNICAYGYEQSGSQFYVLTIPPAMTRSGVVGQTFVYDFTNEMWHERATFDGENQSRHISGEVYAFGSLGHYIGSPDKNFLYKMDFSAHTDDATYSGQSFIDGVPITRMRDSEFISNKKLRVGFPWVEIDYGRGPGGPVNLRLSWAHNRSQAFTNGRLYDGTELLGGSRARWTRLGQSRHRVFRVESVSSGTSSIVLFGGYAEVQEYDS